MFDLFRSRAKAVRYMLGAIMVVVALSMVVTLIPGFVGASYNTNENVIAEIGDDVVSVRDVFVSLNQQMKNENIPPEMRSLYVPLIIDRMIADRSVAYQAQEMGFEITDAELARTIKSLIPDLYSTGSFIGKEIYEQYLQSNFGLTVTEFESNVRKQMLLLKLTNLTLEGTIVTQEEIEAEFRRRNEKIKVDYIAVNPGDYRSKAKVSRDEALAYYEEHKATFTTPSQRDVQIIVIEESEVAKTATVSDAELRAIYDRSLDRFRTGERVKARHILLMTSGKTDEAKQEARTKAEDLHKQLAGGADFAELAKANSEDTGTAPNGGDMGWVERGQQGDQAFLAALFSVEPGQRSDVIEAEYGYHIIEVQEKQSAQLQSFEAVKDQIAQETTRQAVFEKMQELADKSQKELAENPSAAAAIASRNGVRHVQVDRFSVGDMLPEIGTSADAVDLINSLAENGVTEVMTAGADKLAIAAVTKIYPEGQSEFVAVEQQIRERLISQKSMELAEEKVLELEEKVKSAGDDLGKLARAVGMTVKKSAEFARDGTVEGLGSATYIQEAFEKPVGAVVGPIKAMGQTFVCKVVEKTEADLSLLVSQREQIQNELKQRKASMRQELFSDGILTHLINQGKVKINERARDRMVNETRG